ncbi:MAG: tetratricopeptide repeat protein [Desulfovibrionales bacterium]
MTEKKTYSRRDLFRGAFLRRNEGSAASESDHARREIDATLDEAERLYAAGEYGRAAGLYQQVLKTRTAGINLRLRYGLSLYLSGKHIQARVEFSRAVRQEKENRFAHLLLGLAQYKTGQTDRAAGTWQSLDLSSDSDIGSLFAGKDLQDIPSDEVLKEFEPGILALAQSRA